MTGGMTTIRIEAENRWDALDLARHLPRCHWFLVERDQRRWEVCVRTSPRRQRLIRALTESARDWAQRRDLDSVLHLPKGEVALHSGREAREPLLH